MHAHGIEPVQRAVALEAGEHALHEVSIERALGERAEGREVVAAGDAAHHDLAVWVRVVRGEPDRLDRASVVVAAGLGGGGAAGGSEATAEIRDRLDCWNRKVHLVVELPVLDRHRAAGQGAVWDGPAVAADDRVHEGREVGPLGRGGDGAAAGSGPGRVVADGGEDLASPTARDAGEFLIEAAPVEVAERGLDVGPAEGLPGPSSRRDRPSSRPP